MAVRRPTRAGKAAQRRPARKRTHDEFMRKGSALLGGLLICAAVAWFGWLLLRQHNPGLSFSLPFAGLSDQPTAQATADPLAAAGITLGTPSAGQTAALTREQALLLANQMEPQAAAHASHTDAAYVLLTYNGKTASLTSLNKTPAWLVHYSHVASVGPDTAADPHASNPSHDCYIFLDANSGKQLFAIWT